MTVLVNQHEAFFILFLSVHCYIIQRLDWIVEVIN